MAEGLEQLVLHDLRPGKYAVRLFFAEPDDVSVGSRVQHVSLQGRVALSNFDVRAEARGVMRGIVREVEDVAVDGRLTLEMSAVKGETLISGIEVIRKK